MVQGSLEMTFTKRGLSTLMTALETVLESGESTIPELIFTYAGEDRMLNLILDTTSDNCFKVRKHEIIVSIEREDIEDSLLRFEAEKNFTELYPEWIQAVNLANKKNTYIYVSLEPG